MTLRALINQAYPSPEWAVFFEVSDSTGFAAHRRADAIALGVWPSRGNAIVGFEFKEDRRDWLRELKNPAKAEVIATHCDEWWVVIGAEGIAMPEELPAPWGLKVASKDRSKLLTLKRAVPFEGRDKASLKRSFAAAMLRKVTETTVPTSEVDRLVQEAVAKALERRPAANEVELRLARADADQSLERIRKFETASGIKLDGWDSALNLGKAVRALVLVDGTTRRQLENALASSSNATRMLREALDALPAQEAAN